MNSLGKTVIKLAFANFGVCGGPFLGLITAGFLQEKLQFKPITVFISTSVSLVVSAVGGFGTVLGLKMTGIIISPLWWTPFGFTFNLLLYFILNWISWGTSSHTSSEFDNESKSKMINLSQTIPSKPD